MLASILEDIWSQQQQFNTSSQYILFLFSLSSFLVNFDLTKDTASSFKFTAALTKFGQVKNENLASQFTNNKKLNLIDVFGNMQFINQWNQTPLLTKDELTDLSIPILSSRYLMLEYHAYLSFALYSHLSKRQGLD